MITKLNDKEYPNG